MHPNSPPLTVPLSDQLGLSPERAAFEAHMNATAPMYWRTTEHARDAWKIWLAATAAERERIALDFDRRDKGVGGFYDPHEPAGIIRGLETD